MVTENEQRIIDFLKKKGEATRDDMWFWLDIPKSTLHDTLIRLETRGIVNVEKRKLHKIGREANIFSLVKKT